MNEPRSRRPKPATWGSAARRWCRVAGGPLEGTFRSPESRIRLAQCRRPRHRLALRDTGTVPPCGQPPGARRLSHVPALSATRGRHSSAARPGPSRGGGRRRPFWLPRGCGKRETRPHLLRDASGPLKSPPPCSCCGVLGSGCWARGVCFWVALETDYALGESAIGLSSYLPIIIIIIFLTK